MAKTSQNDHVVRVSADFSDLVRASKKAGEKSADLIGSAIQKGIATNTFSAQMAALKKFEKKRLESEKKFAEVVEGREKFAAQTAKKTRAMTEKLASLEQTLSEKNLKASTERRKKAERDLLQERIRSAQEAEKLMEEGSVASLQKVSKELDTINQEHLKIAKSLDRATEQMIRGSERASDFMKSFRRDASQGADDFNEKLQSSLENLKSGLSNVDIGSMLSSGAGSLGKNLGGLSEVAAGLAASGGAMGVLAGSIGGVLLVLAPLVVAFGAFAGLMYGIDKDVKEFNKSAVTAFGTRSVANLGMGNMREGLTVLRHVTQDLNKTLGLTSEEAMGVFDALDSGGVSMAQLTRGAMDATSKEKALGDVLTHTAATAKSLGIGVNEFAGNLAEYTDTLAFSLENVSDQFSNISKQAQEAGFSTRRFYSLITQATAGQASLNTHLDTTAELLVRMSKVLGEKAAGETLGGAAGSFKDTGTQERYKTIMTTGSGRTQDTIEKAATSAARTFARDFAAGGTSDAVSKAIKDAGLNFDTKNLEGAGGASYDENSTKGLVKQLGGMTREGQSELIAAVRAGDPDMARRLEQLVSLSRGTSGSMADMSDALSSLDPGATIAMKLQSAMAILGRPLNELSGVQRMAAESITGLSGAEFERYQALAADSEGRFSIMQRYLENVESLSDAQLDQMAEQYGATIENGKIVAARVEDGVVVTGAEITSGMDLLTASVERGDAETNAAVSEELSLAQDAFDETVTISDILQNEITQYLRGIYEDVGLPMIDMIGDLLNISGSGKSRSERNAARDFQGSLTKGISESNREKSAANRTVTKLERKQATGGTLSPDEAASLADARVTMEAADAAIAASTSALEALSRGDTSALRTTEYRTERGVSMSRASAESLGGPIEEREVAVSGSVAAGNIRSKAASDVFRRHQQQSGGAAPTSPVVAASTVPSPVSVAPPVAPSVAGPTATATTSASEDAADLVTQPIVAAHEEATAVVAEEASSTRAVMETEGEASRKHLDKILTKDMKLGNALARSNLPDAIVAAQVKQQIASLALASGLNGEDAAKAVAEYMESGTVSKALSERLGTLDETGRRDLSGLAGSLGMRLGGGMDGTGLQVLDGRRRLTGSDGPEMGEEVNDFIYQGDGIRGTITPIDPADTFVGSKPGGALDRAGGGGGGAVSISIYGGDERRIFDVVKRVLRETGLGAGRVTSRA